MVAIMSEALIVRPGQRILEVGTGSGYQAAILSRLVGASGRIVTIERNPMLAERAQIALKAFGATNVTTIEGDGSIGHSPLAPYDRIVVTAAAPKLPPPLIDQLTEDGVLLAPVGTRLCDLVRARRTRTGLVEESLGACAFVPLMGIWGQRPGLFGR
jgi:protein-L-isoaspartate(D-aspartate) O-methyltransferase